MRRCARLVAACMILCGCASERHPELVGTWSQETRISRASVSHELTLNKDGTARSATLSEDVNRGLKNLAESASRYMVSEGKIIFSDHRGRQRFWRRDRLETDEKSQRDDESTME